jgi:hypothetical protein
MGAMGGARQRTQWVGECEAREENDGGDDGEVARLQS